MRQRAQNNIQEDHFCKEKNVQNFRIPQCDPWSTAIEDLIELPGQRLRKQANLCNLLIRLEKVRFAVIQLGPAIGTLYAGRNAESSSLPLLGMTASRAAGECKSGSVAPMPVEMSIRYTTR